MRPLTLGLSALLALATALPAAALDRRVEIINNTGFTIVEFYGSNTGSDSWEEDILGTDVLPSGSSVVIDFDDRSGYCKFDFRAVFEDGDVLEKGGVNICEIATFTYQ
ncbi:coproporphyrinogen III oxidase [Rhodobacter amnigenus]|uniref:coproporphyrinogen III oxidase n=1 Tax=Paragemmobacter amnigenus TaxID=2852097 RepID=UPI0013782614|nr:coproporphyrinogen III oxidase [Rhodobacter amnigenus]